MRVDGAVEPRAVDATPRHRVLERSKAPRRTPEDAPRVLRVLGHVLAPGLDAELGGAALLDDLLEVVDADRVGPRADVQMRRPVAEEAAEPLRVDGRRHNNHLRHFFRRRAPGDDHPTQRY